MNNLMLVSTIFTATITVIVVSLAVFQTHYPKLKRSVMYFIGFWLVALIANWLLSMGIFFDSRESKPSVNQKSHIEAQAFKE